MALSKPASEAMKVFDEARDWMATDDHGFLGGVRESRLKNAVADAWASMDRENWLAMPIDHWKSINGQLALFQVFTLDAVLEDLSRQGSVLDKRNCVSFYRADQTHATLSSKIGDGARTMLGESATALTVECVAMETNARAHATASIWMARKTGSFPYGEFVAGAVESMVSTAFSSWPVLEPLAGRLETSLIDFCLTASHYDGASKVASLAQQAVPTSEYVRTMVKADLDRVVTYCREWETIPDKTGLTSPVDLMDAAMEAIRKDLRIGGLQASTGSPSAASMKAIEAALRS